VTGTESLTTSGKTKAARRVLLPSPRVRDALENRWKLDGEPGEGWVCAAETKDEHINQDSVKLQHKKALKLEKLRQFEVDSIRHTFLTGLGESGCDAWAPRANRQTLEHQHLSALCSSVRGRRVECTSRVSGHNSGHSIENMISVKSGELLLNTATRER